MYYVSRRVHMATSPTTDMAPVDGLSELSLRRSILRTHGIRECDEHPSARPDYHGLHAASVTPLETAIAEAFGVALREGGAVRPLEADAESLRRSILRTHGVRECDEHPRPDFGGLNDTLVTPLETAIAEAFGVALERALKGAGLAALYDTDDVRSDTGDSFNSSREPDHTGAGQQLHVDSVAERASRMSLQQAALPCSLACCTHLSIADRAVLSKALVRPPWPPRSSLSIPLALNFLALPCTS